MVASSTADRDHSQTAHGSKYACFDIMRFVAVLSWRSATEPARELDARLVPLLEAIAATGSLAGAVATIGLSYRAAWGLLRDCERDLGVALVDLEQGRGARLARAGEKLVSAHRAATRRLERMRP